MQISNQMNLLQQQATFKGTVDKSAIKLVRKLEKKAIRYHVEQANRAGRNVDSTIIARIKSMAEGIMSKLEKAAETLYKDSKIRYVDDVFCVQNNKLGVRSPIASRVSDAGHHLECKYGNLVGSMYDIYSPLEIHANQRLWGAQPATIFELDCLVDGLSSKRTNLSMVQDAKDRLFDRIKSKNITKPGFGIKSRVKTILDVEKEHLYRNPLSDRWFWGHVKQRLQANAEEVARKKTAKAYNGTFLR